MYPEPRTHACMRHKPRSCPYRVGTWHHELGKVIEERVAWRRGLVAVLEMSVGKEEPMQEV